MPRLGNEPGLVAYLCAGCGSANSVLVYPEHAQRGVAVAMAVAGGGPMSSARHDVELRIMPNGDGGKWYWEVVHVKDVVARGVTDTELDACAAAHDAAREADLVDD